MQYSTVELIGSQTNSSVRLEAMNSRTELYQNISIEEVITPVWKLFETLGISPELRLRG